MLHGSVARLSLAALLLLVRPASAETLEIDLAAALARAHRAAPEAIAARGRIAETEAEVAGAGVVFDADPALEAGLGPRLVAGHALDAEVRLAQELAPGRRGPRRELAAAARARAVAEADAALRDLDLAVGTAFYDAVFSAEVAAQAAHAEALAEAAAAVAQRRRSAGEITDLDVDLARIALGRARSATQLAIAARTAALGALAGHIGAGASETIVLRGTLAPVPEPGAGVRADLRALDRARDVAAAEHAQAIAAGRPGLGAFVSYQREDGTDIVLGGLQVTLPVWDRTRGERDAARAHARTATEARDAAGRRAEREQADARAALAATRHAVEGFARDVVPLLDDSDQLLQRSFDAGRIAIAEYLVARQEILSGRRDYLERQLALAKAALALRHAIGGAP